ncbi:MAG: hypothetical protein HOW59_37060 [Nonomuraea sp.]|nr:hypothetical protein [Nonomuraea sp.]NUQ31342.1 hypothetical protein [Dermatophilaceae bacterium]NUR81094.1 hypothetical protein [Dermatophilaceae bacterium]
MDASTLSTLANIVLLVLLGIGGIGAKLTTSARKRSREFRAARNRQEALEAYVYQLRRQIFADGSEPLRWPASLHDMAVTAAEAEEADR